MRVHRRVHDGLCIDLVKDAAKLVRVIAEIGTIENVLERAGFTAAQEEMRPVNETRFEARWQLGKLLAKMERGITAFVASEAAKRQG
jgi:hypothetical protein